MNNYKALRVNEVETPEGKSYQRVIENLAMDALPEGDVLIKVHYSSLNYKDALSAHGNPAVTRNFPHTPGIDASGEVVSSDCADFKVGQEVIVTGYDLGMNTAGGFAEYIRVPNAWVTPLPSGLSLRQAMVLGTAGLTAGLCVAKLLQVGIEPEQGPVLVSGASGGVGCVAVALLARLGFEVHASSGKAEHYELLKSLGAKEIISREDMQKGVERPMLRESWAGAVDTVGGDILFNIIKATKHSGAVACCGLVAGIDFKANVFPFILRGVSLLGVDSVELPLAKKAEIWQKFAKEWNLDLESVVDELELEAMPQRLETAMKGLASGRTIVRIA